MENAEKNSPSNRARIAAAFGHAKNRNRSKHWREDPPTEVYPNLAEDMKTMLDRDK